MNLVLGSIMMAFVGYCVSQHRTSRILFFVYAILVKEGCHAVS